MSQVVVEIQGLSRRFGNSQALKDVSLQVTAGQVVGMRYAGCALALWSCWIAVLCWLLVQMHPAQPLTLTAYWWLSAYCMGSLAAAALAPWGLSLHRHR